jgi:hypothetical protein
MGLALSFLSRVWKIDVFFSEVIDITVDMDSTIGRNKDS